MPVFVCNAVLADELWDPLEEFRRNLAVEGCVTEVHQVT